MMRRRIPLAVAMIAVSGVLGAGCGGSNYSSDVADNVPVTGVLISESTVSILKGGTRQLSATLVPSNATERRLAWSSSNQSIATVTTTGLVAGTGVGTAVITVTSADGLKAASCTVTVSLERIAVTALSLDPSDVYVHAGSSSPSTVVARVEPPNANEKNVTWSVADPTIAALTGSGASATISGLKVGTTTITAISQDDRTKTATATVHVTPVAVTGVALSQAELSLQAPKAGIPNGDAVPLTATIAPSDASNRDLTWTTSDAAVATLTSTTGATVTVVAHKQGTATVTVRTVEGGFTQSCKVTVVAPPAVNVAVTGVNLNPTVVSLEATPATTTIVYAIVEPADATKKGVYWTTSNKSVAAISPVSGGSATGDSVSGSAVIVTAAGLGAAKLTATTEDGGHQAMADVGVYMVDAEISGTLAGTLNPSSKAGYFDTKLGGAGAYQEAPVGKLVLYSDDSGLQNGGTGINFFYYGAGSTPATVGVAIPKVKSYLGIPASSATPPSGTASLKITVTASAPSGSPRIALVEHSTRKPIQIKSMAEGPPYVFDGVPPGVQFDLVDGAADGQTLNISHVRVEPSTTGQQDITPPADVTSASATAPSGTSLTLSWTNPANADFDHAEISCASTTAVSSVNVPMTASSYTFTGLTTGTSYVFSIKAVDGTGNKSAGVNVTGTPASVAPLLDETFTQAVADAVKAAATASYARVTISASKLAFSTANANGFEWRSAASKAWINGWGVLTNTSPYVWTPTVGGTPPAVRTYVAVPATITASAPTSAKITITAAQHQAYANHHLLILDATNKAIAIGPTFPNGQGDATTLLTFVVDGVRPNTEIRITSDNQYLLLGGIKVENSTTPATDTPTIVQK